MKTEEETLESVYVVNNYLYMYAIIGILSVSCMYVIQKILFGSSSVHTDKNNEICSVLQSRFSFFYIFPQRILDCRLHTDQDYIDYRITNIMKSNERKALPDQLRLI